MNCPCCGEHMNEEEKDSLIVYTCNGCGLKNSELKK